LRIKIGNQTKDWKSLAQAEKRLSRWAFDPEGSSQVQHRIRFGWLQLPNLKLESGGFILITDLRGSSPFGQASHPDFSEL
jgi:hypothetical protein